MKTRLLPLGMASLALLAAGGPGIEVRAQEDARRGAEPPATSRVAPTPPDFDLRRIRNIFRYGDAPAVDRGPTRTAAPPPAAGPTGDPSPAPRARLVGLVEREGRSAAALSVDGEVVVLAEGESVGGFTVLSVTDEAVRLRDPEGDEETLLLP